MLSPELRLPVHFALLWLGSLGWVSCSTLPPPSGSTILSPDARLERVFTRQVDVEGGLTEGSTPALDGSIYFSDILPGETPGMILRFDPGTMKTTVFTADSGKSNGLKFDTTGHLLACEGSDHGGRRVSRWNVKTKTRETVADRFDGKRFNAPNDLCIDRQGRIYFSDPRYLGDEPRELEHRAVYRIETDGTVIEITHDVEKPNGIVLSPDGKTLYVADHNNGTDKIDPEDPNPPPPGAMRNYAFPLGPDGKVNGLRRTMIDFGEEAGCDGMTIDEQGNLYLTARRPSRPGVLVLDPEGKEVAFIPTGLPGQSGSNSPTGIPANVCFGRGEEMNVLYICVDTSLYRIPLKVKGYVGG